MHSLRKLMPLAVLALVYATNSFGAAKRDFQAGKLLSVTVDERLEDGTTYRWAVFTVQIGDLVITARGGRVRRSTGDIGKGLIVGDPVQAAIDGSDLILLGPDRKELKAKITKRARAQ